MSEAARSRRDDPRYEPPSAAPGHDAIQGYPDPLAELARLVGQDDPFRSVFRPVDAPAPYDHAADGRARRDLRNAPDPAEAGPHHGHDDGHDDVDHAYDQAHAQDHDPAYDAGHHGDGQDAHDDRYRAAEREERHDEAGFADERFATDAAAASTLPDMWARGGDGFDADVPSLDHGVTRPALGADRRASARRPLAVMAAVLLLTGGGLAASFFAKGPSAPGVAAASSGRGAPTIMAATGPTKVKIEDTGATAPEDQDAALLNKNGNVSSGPVKIVSSQEQPVDLGQLPKPSDLADGARPLPPATPSPFPEPKKVKTFVVHPNGTMLSADDGSPAPAAARNAGATDADALGSALQAPSKSASRGGTTPKSAAPADAIAALTAQPADAVGATPAKPARQPASPGVRPATVAKPNDTAGTPAAGSGYGVQLASSPVEADANAAFSKLKRKYPAQLGSLTASIHKAETGDKPVYRVRVGSMSQDEAKALCSQLQGAGGSCYVVHN